MGFACQFTGHLMAQTNSVLFRGVVQGAAKLEIRKTSSETHRSGPGSPTLSHLLNCPRHPHVRVDGLRRQLQVVLFPPDLLASPLA